MSNLSFNPCIQAGVSTFQIVLNFLATSYTINNSAINFEYFHKDLGIIISNDLQWNHHHDYVLDKVRIQNFWCYQGILL